MDEKFPEYPECPEEILWDEEKLRMLAREPDLKRQAELWNRVMSEIVFGSLKA